MRHNKWIIDGLYTDTDGWQTIVSPNTFPNPQNEVSPTIDSTSRNVELLNGARARVSYDNKTVKGDIVFSVSVLWTNENRTYYYLNDDATPAWEIVELTYKEIFDRIISGDISVRIRRQEYNGSWVTKDTYAGYFRSVGRTYRLMGTPQLYINDITLERFDVDGTGVY